MISCLNIGNNGRLGNQLFQFAATIGIARKNNYTFVFPNNKNFRIPEIFDINKELITDQSLQLTQFNEKQFHFDENLFKINDNITLNGYFQTEKYFEHISEELKNILKFKEQIILGADKIIEEISKSGKDLVSIHLRVGDYKMFPDHHPICSVEYYKKAIEEFDNENCLFLIFSDESEAFLENFFYFIKNKIILKTNNDGVDLCLMSKCHHNIIANSSFSWWGAWFNENENKKVIAPTPWFGKAYSQWCTDDLYCKNWIKHEC